MAGYDSDKKISGLDPIPDAPAPEDMEIPCFRDGEDKAEASTTEKLNRTTRASAGLNNDGTYNTDQGANYIDGATSIHEATQILDDKVGKIDGRIMTKKMTISSSTLKLSLVDGIRIIDVNSGEYPELLSLVARLDFNTTPYVHADQLRVGNKDIVCYVTNQVLNSTEDVMYRGNFINDPNVRVEEGPLYLGSASLPVDGDSDLILYLTYRVIDL